MSKQSGGTKLIKKAKLITWEEVPMASHRIIEMIDRSFRDILDTDEPFGGKSNSYRRRFLSGTASNSKIYQG